MQSPNGYPPPCPVDPECLRLEFVTTCVGFDEILDFTLGFNHGQVDTVIVVTSHEDKATQGVCKKHGAICVQTDLFRKNGRKFNKGAAINSGLSRFQYHGWRMHLDCDIVLPDSFRRLLFNHTHLDVDCLYGCDRVNVYSKQQLRDAMGGCGHPHGQQHIHSAVIKESPNLGARYVDHLHGYVPLGFFQLWNARNQHSYPYSLGTAEHDDLMFATQWPVSQRRHLPSAIVYHVDPAGGHWGLNWEGRKSPRLQ